MSRRTLALFGVAVAGAAGLAVVGPVLWDGGEHDGGPASMARSTAGKNPISARQEWLEKHPDDGQAWAELGQVYVEQARRTMDPSYYAKADGALKRSLEEMPDRNADAHIGLGALAVARHDFARGRDHALTAKKINPYRGPVYGVLTDAYLELGEHTKARKAAQRMLDTAPGVPAYLRGAHLMSQTGDDKAVRKLFELAEDAISSRADLADVHHRLGEHEWNRGRPEAALEEYERVLKAVPDHLPSLAGRGRVRAALGRTADAVEDYRSATARNPAPALVLEYGELLASLGRAGAAKEQFRLFTAAQRLLADAGVADDLALARYHADHGDPAQAVRHARAEWNRRRSADVADAYAWALHRAGQSERAGAYARRAARRGRTDARFAYHRGQIERALGNERAARAHLRRALDLNPHFSPLLAPRARKALE